MNVASICTVPSRRYNSPSSIQSNSTSHTNKARRRPPIQALKYASLTLSLSTKFSAASPANPLIRQKRQVMNMISKGLKKSKQAAMKRKQEGGIK